MTTFSLSNRDAVAWLERLPSDSVSLAITDPPYESLEKHRAIGTTTRLKHSKASSNDWFAIFPNDRFDELFTQLYRVLAKNSHLYLYCDPETMFFAKPAGERAGFRFWKPLIWDKCLGPDTLVWTERGVVKIEDVVVGDRVAIPEGGSTTIQAVRRTRAPAVTLRLSDGTSVVASREHRFVRADGAQVEAGQLRVGDALWTRPVRQRMTTTLDLDAIIPDDESVDSSYPHALALDHALGRLIGLAGVKGPDGSPGAIVEFAQASGVSVDMTFKIMKHLVLHFIGGHDTRTRYVKPAVYAATDEFRRGFLDGLIEADRHPSHERPTATGASPDLSMFVLRARRAEALTVTAVEDAGVQELVDVSVTDRDQLFVLANGLVTHNCRIGMGYHYRARYECVLFFEKGKRKLADLGVSDIIRAPRVVGGYPAEKPPEVSEILIQQSSSPGELVIDPFMGSGSVGVAAMRHRRAFAGNDLCQEAIEITERRLEDAGGTPVAESIASAPAGQLGLSLG